jgi:hypothetical protein
VRYVILGHDFLLSRLNLEELLIHMLLVVMDLLGVVTAHVEACKQALRDET